MRRTGIFFSLLLLAAGLGLPHTAAGQRSADQPIDITADRLEADDAAGQVKFIGRVVARQGDVTLYSGEMILFLTPETRDVERVEAYGEVRIVQGERVAVGRKGVFFRNEGRIVLTGDPRVHQGEDMISGDEIVVFLQEEKSIVRGGEGSRVKAVFHPKGDGG